METTQRAHEGRAGSAPAVRLPAPRRRGTALAAATLALFAALAAFGARTHWVEEVNSAERDGYAAQADRILAGRLPDDPFRPALYPLLVAALGAAVGDTFTAARLISNAAAAAVAALAFALAARLAGRGDPGTPGPATAGALAFALAAVNPNLWTLGQNAATDMFFAALATGAVLAGLVYLEDPGWRPALAAGACLGLALFTRGSALFLAPPLLAAWWLAPRRRGRHLAAAAGLALLLVAPEAALRAAAFGDPFHDENWKNLAWKLHGYPDWSALGHPAVSGPGELLRRDGAAIVRGGFAELVRFFAGGGLAQLLGTPVHVLAAAAGALAALVARRRATAWLLAAGATFLAGVAFSFFTWGRLVLLLLPVGAACAAAPWGGGVRQVLTDRWRAATRRRGGAGALRRAAALRATAAAAGVALVALLAVKTFLFRLPAFVAHHPYGEVAALRALADRVPPGTVLAGVSPFLGRYLDRPYLYVRDAFGREVTDPGLYLGRLHRELERRDAAFLVVDPVDLRDRPAALLAAEPPAPWLAPAGGAGGVRVWRVER